MVTFFCPVLVSVIWELTVPTLLPPRWIWDCLSPPAGPWPSRTAKHSCTHTLAGTRTGKAPCHPRSCHGSRHPWGIVSRSPPPRSRRTSSAQLALVSWLNHHRHRHRQSHLRWHMLAWSNPRYPTATHRLRDIGEPFCDHHFLLDGKLVQGFGTFWNNRQEDELHVASSFRLSQKICACEHGQKFEDLVALGSSEIDLRIGVHSEEQPQLYIALGPRWNEVKNFKGTIVFLSKHRVFFALASQTKVGSGHGQARMQAALVALELPCCKDVFD